MLPRSAESEPVLTADAEPIPGYRLLSPLGKGGFGEVWKCEAPGGLHKAVKVVHAAGRDSVLPPEQCGAEQELRALQHIKTLRHPFLLSTERVERVGQALVIVMELADCSLHDLLEQCRSQGKPGVPREELLGYMLEAAEVLDLMNQEYGLQHLDVKPRNLFLVGRHVKVADFGLVASLAEMTGQKSAGFQLAAITPLYAAPESFTGKITLFSDQYSLAVVYHELLTGVLPFDGKNFRALAMQHMAEPPNLSRLSEVDQAVVGKSLAKEPRQRYANCLEFVRALIAEASPSARQETASVYTGPKNSTQLEISLARKPSTTTLRPPTKSLRTVRPRAEPRQAQTVRTPVPDADVSLDDHQFLDCLGSSPLGEMWKTEAPDGTPCLVKLVNTFSQGGLFGDEDPMQRLRQLDHPGLLPTTYLPREPNRLALISGLTPDTVAGRFQAARANQQPDLERETVLDWLAQAAQTLDELFVQHRLQHLGLNPRSLILADDELLWLADFGLVQLVWLPAGQEVAQMNGRYAAPELFDMVVTRHSDQYSLALLYYELVTGVHPFANQSQRQLAQMRSSGAIDVDLVPPGERRVLLRALHPEAHRRFDGCGELIEALRDPGARVAPASGLSRAARQSGMVPALPPQPARVTPPLGVRSSGIRAAVRVEQAEPTGLLPASNDQRARDVLAQIVMAAAGDLEVREFRGIRYSIRPGVSVEHVGYARIVPGTVELKLAVFCEQWRALAVEQQDDLFVYRINLTSSFLMRCLGKQPALEVTVQVVMPRAHQATMADVLIRIRAVGCGKDQAQTALDRQAPALIDSLRTCLQAGPERRRHVRLPYQMPLQVQGWDDVARGREPQVAQGKDITLDGMGLYMRSAPTNETLVVKMQRSAVDPVVDVLAKVVRVNTCGDGRYEVGLRFLAG